MLLLNSPVTKFTDPYRPDRPDRPVPYRPVLNIFQQNRECDFFEKLCVGKLTDRRPTDPYPFRTVPKYVKIIKNIYLLMKFDEKSRFL